MSRKEDHRRVSGSNLPGLATNLGPESRWPLLGGSYDKAVISAANERDTISCPYCVGTSVSASGADDQEWEQMILWHVQKSRLQQRHPHVHDLLDFGEFDDYAYCTS